MFLGFWVCSAESVRGETQGRSPWIPEGVLLSTSLITDSGANFRGGQSTSKQTLRTLLDVALEFDTRELLSLEGGGLYLNYQHTHGESISDTLIGDSQGIDSIDSVNGSTNHNRSQISRFWYQQALFSELIRVDLGKMDVNAGFDHVPLAQEFLHQSMGSSATLFTLPTYPDPSTGVNLFIQPSSETRLGLGVYDGDFADGRATGQEGFSKFFGREKSRFFISEIDVSWGKEKLPGHAGIGWWYSTNEFTKLSGDEVVSGTGAPYALISQMLWSPVAGEGAIENNPGVGIFLMYGYANPELLPFDHNLGGGIVWNSPSQERPHDSIGAGFQSVHFSDEFESKFSYETSVEIYYKAALFSWLFVKPDLQYISHPGGRGIPDACAGILRFEFHL